MANGRLNPIFLVQVDRNGLSVLRENAGDDEFVQTVDELRPRWQTKEKSLEGVMTFPASAVRWLDGERLCCVYDTALPGKPHHSDLMMPSLEAGLSNSERDRRQKKRIKTLVDQIGDNFQSIATFRSARLAHLG
ncbi:hypothetical protein [Rhizobium sp. YTU87027]|uniref:hypothetical protein n=1 Tax=Rhizobium sp. YTU87027 TaxID=3417741 RepID=UPI003D6834ED